ncbi:zinc-ribbon domain-containing protein [Paraburkholderia ferrariae]
MKPTSWHAAWSPRVPESTRVRVQRALERLPGPGGSRAPGYRDRVFSAIRDVAHAWGGRCLASGYEGYGVPLEFECAAGHRFHTVIQGLRAGHWCRTCAHERAAVYSLGDAHALAARHGGECLSTHYENSHSRLRWRCNAGHTWLASLDGVARGYWCRACYLDSTKPQQEEIDRTAAERGGGCLSAYVDRDTALEWQCEEGHRWSAPWFRVKKGQWCRQCAVKARTRTIEQMQELAQSRGGRCLSTVYPGPHGKIEWECSLQHVWLASVNSVWRGSWCPECARMERRRSQE